MNDSRPANRKPISCFPPLALKVLGAFGCLGALYFLWNLRVFWPLKIDDAFITYRFAWRLAHEGSLHWNPGQPPVEGYTSFLAVLLTVPMEWLGLMPLLGWKLLGALLSVGGALAAAVGVRQLIASRLEQKAPESVFYLVAGCLLASPIVALHALSGMETALFVFLVLGLQGLAWCWLAGGGHPAWRGDLLAVGMLLLGWARPEGVIWACGAALCILWGLGTLRARGRFLVSLLVFFVLPGALYFGWRLWYFGDFFPATFLVKSSAVIDREGMGRLHNALPYLHETRRYLLRYWLWLILLAAVCSAAHGALWLRQGRLARRLLRDPLLPCLAMGLVSLVMVCFYARVNVHIMGYAHRFHFHFGQALWPPLLAIPLMAALGWRERGRAGFAAGILMLLALVLAQTWYYRIADPDHFYRGPEGGYPLLVGNNIQRDTYQRVGSTLETLADGKRPTLFHHNMGELMYYAPGWNSIDPVGLVDRHVAHHGFSVDYVYERKPELLLLPSKATDRVTEYAYPPVMPDISRECIQDSRAANYQYLGYDSSMTFGDSGAMHFFLHRDWLREEPGSAYYLAKELNLKTAPDFEYPPGTRP